MFKRMSHPIVAAGLTAVLALGAVGCSTSSTTTTEISTTDEDGNTTTETETTTTDAEGNKMGKEAANAQAPTAGVSYNGYTNDYYKIGYALPDGFSTSHQAFSVPEGVQVDYQATNADGSARVLFCLVQGVTKEEGITDINSWVKTYTDAFVSSMKESGYANVNANYGSFDIGGIKYGEAAVVDYDNGGKAGLCFILDEDGDGMIIEIIAPDAATFEKIDANFIALQ